MAETDELSIASKLCLACGLCCDGTVFGFALIEESEVEDTAAIGLQTFRTTNDEPAFRLGCHYLDGTACTRYQSWRPSVCGDYYCQVQKRVRKHEVAEEKAFSMIARARQMTDEIKALLPPGVPISQARRLFKDLAAKQPDLAPDEATFLVKMFVLERFLDSEFRGAKRAHLRGAEKRQASQHGAASQS